MRHGILMRSGFGHATGLHGTDSPAGGQPLGPEEREARWQKHVVIVLWLLFTVLIVVASVLIVSEARGYLNRVNREAPPPTYNQN